MQAIIYYKSPIGILEIGADQDSLYGMRFIDHPTTSEEKGEDNRNHPLLNKVIAELDEYFTGKRKDFDIPLSLEGTEFQKGAWEALTKIPYGETRSYKEEALLAGRPKAIRAIGGANNKNPIVIVIPCHRVIGSSGELIGYAGGIERKKWLLEHEASFV